MLEIVDDPFAGGVYAESDERLVTNHSKSVGTVRRQRNRYARFERDGSLLAREPNLAITFEHSQHLDIGMRMQARLVARRGNLDAGADRQAGAGVVADDRPISGAAGERNGGPFVMAN